MSSFIMVSLEALDTPAAETSRSHILLVDDDRAILEGVADLLSLHGYDVMTAASAKSALKVMQQQVPDLVISDIMMPGMDGYAFYEAVRDNPAWTPIPFIFLTARGQPTDVRRGQSLGADAYVTKPFEPEDLLIAVKARLRRARDIQAAAMSDVEKMKKRLITAFSHELRTPLTIIYGYVNMLRDEHGDLPEAEVDTMLESMHRGTQRLVDLVSDLMLMLQLESGVVELEIELGKGRVSLPRIVEKVADRYRRDAQERGVTLTTEIDPALAELRFSLYLDDALSRLIDNAIKFSPQGTGAVHVAATRNGGDARIAVTDNGIGIDPAKLQVIFEQFEQLDRDLLEQQGVGLGLSLARRLVDLHRGWIEVVSQPGKGSTFTIHLPAN
ncbi:MAG TPA: hybrid sensor histidine kinase/response regulator [Aggregatilineales bacterium]|nr:hybrid sensor histidine kinase/response regulator [Aggregatilineales bacterium]